MAAQKKLTVILFTYCSALMLIAAK